jgi:translation elongation factor EF-Tu-like GTPase
MVHLDALIYFKSTEEGGLSKPTFSGIRPSFNINKDPITCEIVEASGKEHLPLGQEYSVRIFLPYGEIYADLLQKDAKFLLQIGGHLIGWGTITGNIKVIYEVDPEN